MGTFLMVIVGILTALSFTKKEMYTPWVYLVNVSLAIYVSLFSSPLLLSMLPSIPGLEGYKTSAVLLLTAVVVLVLAYKIVGQIVEGSRVFELYELPPVINKTGAGLFGFLSGMVTAAFFLLCYAQTPISKEVTALDRNALRASSVSVVKKMVGTVNFFSGQSMTVGAQTILSNLGTDASSASSAQPPKDSLEARLKAKKEAEAKKKPKKMRILENGVAVPVDDEQNIPASPGKNAPKEKPAPEPEPVREEVQDAPQPAPKAIPQEAVPLENPKNTTPAPSKKKKSNTPAAEPTTTYGRAISKALTVRQKVEKKNQKKDDSDDE